MSDGQRAALIVYGSTAGKGGVTTERAVSDGQRAAPVVYASAVSVGALSNGHPVQR